MSRSNKDAPSPHRDGYKAAFYHADDSDRWVLPSPDKASEWRTGFGMGAEDRALTDKYIEIMGSISQENGINFFVSSYQQLKNNHIRNAVSAVVFKEIVPEYIALQHDILSNPFKNATIELTDAVFKKHLMLDNGRIKYFTANIAPSKKWEPRLSIPFAISLAPKLPLFFHILFAKDTPFSDIEDHAPKSLMGRLVREDFLSYADDEEEIIAKLKYSDQ